MVFSGLYPADGSDFEALNHAIERLTCNDASVSVTKETSTALGMGFRSTFFQLCKFGVSFGFWSSLSYSFVLWPLGVVSWACFTWMFFIRGLNRFYFTAFIIFRKKIFSGVYHC